MAELIEANKNNPKTQTDILLIVSNHTNESYKTQSQTGQTALAQRKFIEEAKEISGKRNDDMDQISEFRDNKNNFLADKIRSSTERFIEQMEQINLNDFLTGRDRVKKDWNTLKNMKKLNIRTLKIFNKFYILLNF